MARRKKRKATKRKSSKWCVRAGKRVVTCHRLKSTANKAAARRRKKSRVSVRVVKRAA